MADELVSSLPSVASPNATDLVPIEHGPSGGPYALSQTTIAELVTAGGGGSSGGSTTPYDSVILAQSPAHYWPLNDAAGSTSAADTVGSNPLTFNGTPTFGFPPLGKDGEPSAYCDDSNYFIIPGAALQVADYTATLLFMPGEMANNNNILALGTTGNNSYLQTLSGGYRVVVNGGGSSTTSSVSAGRAVHLTLQQVSGMGTTLYLNGMKIANVNAAQAAGITSGILGALVCRVAKLAYWDSAISFAHILAQVTAAGL
jgi:hypothetical protein